MIEIKTLSDLKGAERYGTCMSCGEDSDKDRDMIRIHVLTHNIIGGYQGNSICLCRQCKNALMEMLGYHE